MIISECDRNVTKPDQFPDEPGGKRDEAKADQTSPRRACSSPRLQVMSNRVPFLSSSEYRPEPAGWISRMHASLTITERLIRMKPADASRASMAEIVSRMICCSLPECRTT